MGVAVGVLVGVAVGVAVGTSFITTDRYRLSGDGVAATEIGAATRSTRKDSVRPSPRTPRAAR